MIRSLEGLRGIAALMVALYHAYVFSHWGGVPNTWELLRQAWLFVDLFFVVSGFVMAMTYGDRIDDARGAAGFMVRRFFRLYPLHIVTTFAVIGAGLLVQTSKLLLEALGHPVGTQPAFAVPFFDPFLLLLDVLMLHGVGILVSALHNYPSWSISVEFWLYLIFAVLMLAVRGRRVRAVVAAAIVAGCIAWFLARWSVALPEARTLDVHGLPRGLLGFFQGVLLYEAWRSRIGVRLRAARGLALSLLQIALAVLALQLIASQPVLGAAQVLVPTSFALLVLALLPDRGLVAAGLATTPLQWLGRHSYSIYMVHVTVLTFLDFYGRSLPEPAKHVVGAVYVLAVFGLAALTYRFVEVPWRRRGQALAARVAPPAGAPGIRGSSA